MPKRIFEIRNFDNGIMSNPEDELDIPANSATYSLNIDPLTRGELKGVPKSSYLKRTGLHGALASAAGGLITRMSDDQDPTTLTGGETLGTLVGSGGTGASLAATLGGLSPKLAAIPGLGWLGAGVGAGLGIWSALRKKRQAKKAKKKVVK